MSGESMQPGDLNTANSMHKLGCLQCRRALYCVSCILLIHYFCLLHCSPPELEVKLVPVSPETEAAIAEVHQHAEQSSSWQAQTATPPDLHPSHLRHPGIHQAALLPHNLRDSGNFLQQGLHRSQVAMQAALCDWEAWHRHRRAKLLLRAYLQHRLWPATLPEGQRPSGVTQCTRGHVEQPLQLGPGDLQQAVELLERPSGWGQSANVQLFLHDQGRRSSRWEAARLCCRAMGQLIGNIDTTLVICQAS